MTGYFEYKTSTNLFSEIVIRITNHLNLSLKDLPNSINNLYLRIQFLFFYCLPTLSTQQNYICSKNNFYRVFNSLLGLNRDRKKKFNSLFNNKNDLEDPLHPPPVEGFNSKRSNIISCINFSLTHFKESSSFLEAEKKRISSLEKFSVPTSTQKYFVSTAQISDLKKALTYCKKGIELREAYCSYFFEPSSSNELAEDGHYYCLLVLKRCYRLLHNWFSSYQLALKILEQSDMVTSQLNLIDNQEEKEEKEKEEEKVTYESIENTEVQSEETLNLPPPLLATLSSPLSSLSMKKKLKLKSKNLFLYFSVYWDCLLLLRYIKNLWLEVGAGSKSIFLAGLMSEISYKLLPSVLSYSYEDPKLNTVESFQYLHHIISSEDKEPLKPGVDQDFDFDADSDLKFPSLSVVSLDLIHGDDTNYLPSFSYSSGGSSESPVLTDVQSSIEIYSLATQVVKDFARNVLLPGVKFKKSINLSSVPLYFHINSHKHLLDVSPYIEYFSNISAHVTLDSLENFHSNNPGSSLSSFPPSYNYCYFILLISLHDFLNNHKDYSNFYPHTSNNCVIKNFDSKGIEIAAQEDPESETDCPGLDFSVFSSNFFNFSVILNNFFSLGGNMHIDSGTDIPSKDRDESSHHEPDGDDIGFEITFLVASLVCFFNGTMAPDLRRSLTSSLPQKELNHNFFYHQFRRNIPYFHEIIVNNHKAYFNQISCHLGQGEQANLSLFFGNGFSSEDLTSKPFTSSISSNFLSLTNMFSVQHELFNSLNFLLNYSNNFLSSPSVMKSKMAAFYLIYIGLKQLEAISTPNNYLEMVLHKVFFSLFLMGIPSRGCFEYYYYNVLYNNKMEDKRAFRSELSKRDKNIRDSQDGQTPKLELYYYNDYYQDKKKYFISPLNNSNSFLCDTLTLIELKNLKNVAHESISECLQEIEQRLSWEFSPLSQDTFFPESILSTNKTFCPEQIIDRRVESSELDGLKARSDSSVGDDSSRYTKSPPSQYSDFNNFFLDLSSFYDGFNGIRKNHDSINQTASFVTAKSFFLLNIPHLYDLISLFFFKLLVIPEIRQTFNDLTNSMYLSKKLKVHGEEALSILKSMFSVKGFDVSAFYPSVPSSESPTNPVMAGALFQVVETSVVLTIFPLFDKPSLNTREEAFISQIVNVFSGIFYNHSIECNFSLLPHKTATHASHFPSSFLPHAPYFDSKLYNHSPNLSYFYKSLNNFECQILSEKQTHALQSLIKNKLSTEMLYPLATTVAPVALSSHITIFDYCFNGPLNDFFFFEWLFYNTNPAYSFSLFNNKIPFHSKKKEIYYYYLIYKIKNLNDFSTWYFLIVTFLPSFNRNMIRYLRKLLKSNFNFNYSRGFIHFHLNSLLDYLERKEKKVL